MYHITNGQILLPNYTIFWRLNKISLRLNNMPKILCVLDCLRGQNVDVAKSLRQTKPTLANIMVLTHFGCGRWGGLMVSVLLSTSSGLGSSPGWGQCVVFLGKTLSSHSASLYPGV